MQKFATPSLLDGKDFTFEANALERKGNHYEDKKGRRYYPPAFHAAIYFVAEVAIHLNTKGSGSVYQHFFQLNLASIKTELAKCTPITPDSILIKPDGIVNVLNVAYYEIADWLEDFNNEKDNYRKIAEIIYKYRGTAAAGPFGV